MTVSWIGPNISPRLIRRSALAVLLLGALALVAPTPAAAAEEAPAEARRSSERPLLWLVDGPTRLWIYGTLHTNDPRVLARPPAVDLAFRQSDGFFAEMDLDRDLLGALMQVASLPEGETLSALLAPALRKRLVARLEALGQSLATYEGLEPWVLWFTLHAAVQGEAGGEGMPLDWRLFQEAKRTGKTIGGLESALEQFAPFAAMEREQQVRLVERSLEKLEQATPDDPTTITPLERITRAWLAGDEIEIVELTRQLSGAGDELDAELSERLLDRRNERMAVRLAAISRVSRGRTLFVAVGAAHLAGPRGLLALLEAHGFEARRVIDVDEVRRLAPRSRPGAPCAPPPCPPPPPCRPRPRCGPFGLPLPPFVR
ncbi:MAG: TraB/GumN family protein [Planctomycetota bacterium]